MLTQTSMALHVNILPPPPKKGGKRNLQNDVVLLYTILEFNPNSGFAEIVTLPFFSLLIKCMQALIGLV